MSFAERLRLAMGQLSAYAVAKAAEIDSGQLSRYLAGTATPSLPTTVKLADALHVRMDWLASGSGPMRDTQEEVPARRKVQLRGGRGGRFTPFSWGMMEDRMRGALIVDDASNEPLLVRVRLLDPDAPLAPPSEDRPFGAVVPMSSLGRLGALHEQLVAFVAGAPLPPSVDAGDRLVVDLTKSKAPLAEGIYLFAAGGELLLRRLRKRTDGQLEVVSMDASSVLTDGDMANLVGKVVWRGGKV